MEDAIAVHDGEQVRHEQREAVVRALERGEAKAGAMTRQLLREELDGALPPIRQYIRIVVMKTTDNTPNPSFSSYSSTC